MAFVMRTLALPAMLVAALFAAAMVAQPPRNAADAVLFEGARLIVGDGGPGIERSAFIVRNSRFTRVGKRAR